MAQDECTLDEALRAAKAAGLVMQPGAWMFMEGPEELSALSGTSVRVNNLGSRREVLLPNGDRLTFVPSHPA